LGRVALHTAPSDRGLKASAQVLQDAEEQQIADRKPPRRLFYDSKLSRIQSLRAGSPTSAMSHRGSEASALAIQEGMVLSQIQSLCAGSSRVPLDFIADLKPPRRLFDNKNAPISHSRACTSQIKSLRAGSSTDGIPFNEDTIAAYRRSEASAQALPRCCTLCWPTKKHGYRRSKASAQALPRAGPLARASPRRSSQIESLRAGSSTLGMRLARLAPSGSQIESLRAGSSTRNL